MGWASKYIEQLKAGLVVQFRPHGHSMKGKIESGQLVTVEPVTDQSKLEIDQVVLCRVNGHEYLHLIRAVRGKQFQIGNNHGGINGWISANAIYGRCIKIEN